jgi:pyridoxamine 5'-phosphate oxidase
MARPAHTDPVDWLRADRARALERRDPCAGLCVVASVDAAGNPDARTMVLRDVEGRFAVFANRTSPKWPQLSGAVPVAVVVWLPTLEVQYRLRCRADAVPDAVVHASWRLRPEIPKRLDWVYTAGLAQGSAVADRDALVAAIREAAVPDPLVAPRTAGGFFLEPFLIDRLDLAQPDGIHDRRRFERAHASWLESILVP